MVYTLPLVLPSQMRDKSVWGLFNWHDHCLWSGGDGTCPKRTELKRKLVENLCDSIKGGWDDNDSCTGLMEA